MNEDKEKPRLAANLLSADYDNFGLISSLNASPTMGESSKRRRIT
jgi:hypothetical protein